MASEPSSALSHAGGKTPMSTAELVTFVKKELDADAERHAQGAAAGAGEFIFPRESPTSLTLDLSNKNLHQLPVEIIALIKDCVERLALSHNARIVLPVQISQCDRLRYLNLRWNKLNAFPAVVLGLPKLEILDISKNAIESIPEDIKKMTNLKFLAVARNNIKRLPLAIGEMNLVKLKFDENPIEFPPPDALKPQAGRMPISIETDKDKEVCQQVKRFMKNAALRERIMSHSEDDTSEKVVETPRPPKRGVTGGRFPVRPSISSIEPFNNEPKGEPAAEIAPPIPARSHARASSNAPSLRRPSTAAADNSASEVNRNRGENGTMTLSKVNSRRQGIVPRKNTNLGAVNELSLEDSTWMAFHSMFTTPSHSRTTSTTSSHNSEAAVEISAEPPSAVASPAERSVNRTAQSRRLSRLPASRLTPASLNKHILAIRRVHALLLYLVQPMSDVARQRSRDAPAQPILIKHITGARAQIEELGRLVQHVNHASLESPTVDPALLSAVVRNAVVALDTYMRIVRELKRTAQTIRSLDALYTRNFMLQAYGTVVEARNICHLLGVTPSIDPAAAAADRASITWSSRTVTPTYARPMLTSRRRGPLAHSGTNGAPGIQSQPFTNGSRTNTMTSLNIASGPPIESHDMPTPMTSGYRNPSRSNTMRSVAKGSSNGETIDDPVVEYAYTKLRDCFALASQILPPTRSTLFSKKTHAHMANQPHTEYQCNTALIKCDAVINTCNRSHLRLRNMRFGEFARHYRDFTMMNEQFTKDWADFGSEIVPFRNHADIGTLRQDLKPIHAAVKEANRAVTQLLQHHNALSPPRQPLATPWPPSINTNLSHLTTPSITANSHPPHSAVGSSSSSISSVPATPLTAALGAAAQAALTSTAASTASNTATTTPTSSFSSPQDYLSLSTSSLPPLPPTPQFFPPNLTYPSQTQTAQPQPSQLAPGPGSGNGALNANVPTSRPGTAMSNASTITK